MRKNLLIIALISFNHFSFSQEKIKADLDIYMFFGRDPYKSESNISADNLLRILYFNPQPANYSKTGYMDTKENILMKPTYNMGSDFYGDYANIIKDSVFGYIDKKGSETMFPQYDETFFYYGNTGIAKKNNMYGLIDRKGNPLTDFKYYRMFFFGFNHIKALLKDGKGHLLDSKGNIIFNKNLEYNIDSDYFEQDSLLIFSEKIDNKDLKGLVTLKNNVLVKPKYEGIYSTDDKELFAVEKDKKWGFINNLGNEIIPIIYDVVDYNTIEEDLIPAKKMDKWGFINRKNEIVIPFIYDEAYPFYDGLAYVKKENYYGCIDKHNTIKVQINLEKPYLPFYSDNLTILEKEGKYGFVNKKGKVVIPVIYEKVYPFANGMAYVELNGKVGYINKKGKEVIPIKYKQLWFESEGIIRFAE